MDAEKLRAELLQACLAHVAFDGWSRTALRAGARDLDVDPALALNAFPGGEAELIEAFSTWADHRMLDALAERDLAAVKVRERIAAAVRSRLVFTSEMKYLAKEG